MHMKCVSSTVERSEKCVAENAQCYTRARFSRRRIGANQRIGNSLDFRCRRNTSLLFLHGVARCADASQPARRFSRINEPRANYSPPWKLSWKYWKVRGVEWLLPVSGATILLCTGYRTRRRFLTNSKYKWKKKKKKKQNAPNEYTCDGEEWRSGAWEWNKRSSIVGRICRAPWNQPHRPWDFNGSLNRAASEHSYIGSIVLLLEYRGT